jgi:hypothetical protein
MWMLLFSTAISATNMASNYFSQETFEEKMASEEKDNENQPLILTQMPEEIIEKILALLTYNDLAEARGVSVNTSWSTM